MAGEIKKVRWRGKDYVLVYGKVSDDNAALATQEQFDNFELSHAHVYFDTNEINRFGEVIGEATELEYL